MKDITFGKHTIGKNHPVLIIAEIACEHRGNMDNAKRLIREAKQAGADIAKFQLHVPDKEMVAHHPKLNFWAGSLDDVLAEVNFGTKEQHQEIKAYCEEVGIQYLCTPFCREAADILMEVGVDGFKTGSGEFTDLPMLRYMAKLGKPMIVSTGMSTEEEVQNAVAVLREEGVDFALTHCLSEYPASYENMNLRLIDTYTEKFDVPVGYSDHSTDIIAAVAAVARGARIIEKHFTVREFHGPDDLVSLDMAQFTELVHAIRNTEKAMGNTRTVSPKEQETKDWAEHSVVTADVLRAGETLTLEKLTTKRPGGGVKAKYLDPLFSAELLGRRVKHDVPANTVLQWDDLTD